MIGFEWARGRGETGGGKLVKDDSEWEEPSQGVMLSGATDETGGWLRFLGSAQGVAREGLAADLFLDEPIRGSLSFDITALSLFSACFCF